MVTVSRLLALHSSKRRQLIDITDQVLTFAENALVKNGVCIISVPHATAAVIANEHEGGLMEDILSKIDVLFPQSARYAHNAIDDNADAHLAATFLGSSRLFPIADGRLVRGTWQNIFLVELDGPRTRRDVWLQAIGEN